VDRTKADGFDRAAPLAPRAEFFDASKTGKAKRDIVAPRFRAYGREAPIDVPGGWISSAEGAFAERIVVGGLDVGIVGINTAWLSKDNKDQGKLTPGFGLPEAALKKIKDCQVRFVLGHHPLNWFDEDKVQPLRALFGQHRVIYLHGHLHKSEGHQEDGSGQPFLILQAGAAFQARDDEPWRNGLLWGEIDLGAEQVRVSPRFWNPDHLDWPVETGRFPERLRQPGSDWWVFPLPLLPTQKGVPNQPAWQPPEGWEVLTTHRLDAMRRPITPAEAERFFDGAEPDWAFALCPKLPRRALVALLAERIASFRGTDKPLVLLLTGPGGEGKSMVLRQTLVTLVEADPTLKVLWHSDESRALAPDALARLPDGPWVIATDAADLTSKSLYEAAAALHRGGRTDVRFLLCARDTDWRAAKAGKHEWYRHADHQIETLSGLNETDAGLIATAWAELAASGSPDAVADPAARAADLYQAAMREAAAAEGSLLGGALAVRRGVGLRDHVHRLLDRLGEQRLASGGTLYHAFGYIAAMHAEGLDFLSRPVLAKVLGCDLALLGERVVVPLAREAAGGGGSVLLTRHRRIAEEAVSIMVEEFGDDVAGRLEDLVGAAKRARPDGFVPDFWKWEYQLPDHFMRESPEMAIRLARAVWDMDPGNAKLAVNFARICRECREPGDGAGVLAAFTGEVSDDRSFWYEWATCAGNARDYCANALLGGWSLADQAAPGRPDNKQAKLSLAGLGVAFRELHGRFRDPRFAAGLAAVAHLGLRLELDPKTQGYFEHYRRDAKAAGADTADAAQALQQFRAALAAAWEVGGQPASLAARVVPPASMGFAGLIRLVAAGAAV
jgi:hypothetical protein